MVPMIDHLRVAFSGQSGFCCGGDTNNLSLHRDSYTTNLHSIFYFICNFLNILFPSFAERPLYELLNVADDYMLPAAYPLGT